MRDPGNGWLSLRYTTSYAERRARPTTSMHSTSDSTSVRIVAPSQSNHGIVAMGVAIKLPLDRGCTKRGLRLRRHCKPQAAPQQKFVAITVAFNDSGPDPISITPYAWRLYGDGVDALHPLKSVNPASSLPRRFSSGSHVSGIVTLKSRGCVPALHGGNAAPTSLRSSTSSCRCFRWGCRRCSHPDG